MFYWWVISSYLEHKNLPNSISTCTINVKYKNTKQAQKRTKQNTPYRMSATKIVVYSSKASIKLLILTQLRELSCKFLLNFHLYYRCWNKDFLFFVIKWKRLLKIQCQKKCQLFPRKGPIQPNDWLTESLLTEAMVISRHINTNGSSVRKFRWNLVILNCV